MKCISYNLVDKKGKKWDSFGSKKKAEEELLKMKMFAKKVFHIEKGVEWEFKK